MIMEHELRPLIQESARIIKAEIADDMKWGRAASRRDSLSVDEETAMSAIWQAGCHLRFKTNSNPMAPRWADEIADALIDLSDFGG